MGKLGENRGEETWGGAAHKLCLVPPLLALGGSVNQFPVCPVRSQGYWFSHFYRFSLNNYATDRKVSNSQVTKDFLKDGSPVHAIVFCFLVFDMEGCTGRLPSLDPRSFLQRLDSGSG